LLGINVIERNFSDYKYVEIFTHRVGSIDAPSRRTIDRTPWTGDQPKAELLSTQDNTNSKI
jgi:hypothetical protein